MNETKQKNLSFHPELQLHIKNNKYTFYLCCSPHLCLLGLRGSQFHERRPKMPIGFVSQLVLQQTRKYKQQRSTESAVIMLDCFAKMISITPLQPFPLYRNIWQR